MPRSSTPSRMKSSGPADPSSPPHTPKSSPPPPKQKRNSKKGRTTDRTRQSLQERRGEAPPPSLLPQDADDTRPTVGNGFRFSRYQPDSFRPDQLSPRSTSSSSAEDSDCESSGSDSPPRSHSSEESIKPSVRSPPRKQTPVSRLADNDSRDQTAAAGTKFISTRIVLEASFEVTDFDGSDDEGCEVLRPDLIEYADSERSRSRSRQRTQLDRRMAEDFRDLVFSSSDEDDDLLEDEHERAIRQQREERRRKRMSSGSISKRTISERGSDSDREDLLFRGVVNGSGSEEPGGETRRMRRRLGNRHSLLFQDPPPPRIDELEEPDSSEEILDDSELLARELPYYDYVSMEVDSP